MAKENLKTDDFPFNTPLTFFLKAPPPPRWWCSLFSFHNQAPAVYMPCQTIAAFLPLVSLFSLSVLPVSLYLLLKKVTSIKFLCLHVFSPNLGLVKIRLFLLPYFLSSCCIIHQAGFSFAVCKCYWSFYYKFSYLCALRKYFLDTFPYCFLFSLLSFIFSL